MSERTLPRTRAFGFAALAFASVPFLMTGVLRGLNLMQLSGVAVACAIAFVLVAVVVAALAQRRPSVRAVGAGLTVGTAAWLTFLVWLTAQAVPSWR
jgi:hypothetical protein